jgi:hypothetical protein
MHVSFQKLVVFSCRVQFWLAKEILHGSTSVCEQMGAHEGGESRNGDETS